MTAHIWQIKTEQHKKKESFLKGLIFQHLVSLIPSFDMDEYSSLRRCLLELAKRQGGELKQDVKWWIHEQANYIRLESFRSKVFCSVYGQVL